MQRKQRHELALQQLSKETDFFRYFRHLRTADFTAKTVFKKYQRSLVPFFKKYQLTQLRGDEKKPFIGTDALGSTAQKLLEGEDESMLLESRKLELLESVQQNFDAALNLKDLMILYEVTGYQGDVTAWADFDWTDYARQRTLGISQIAINEDSEDSDHE